MGIQFCIRFSVLADFVGGFAVLDEFFFGFAVSSIPQCPSRETLLCLKMADFLNISAALGLT